MPNLFIQPIALCICRLTSAMPCIVCGKILPPGIRMITIMSHQPVCMRCGTEADADTAKIYTAMQENEAAT